MRKRSKHTHVTMPLRSFSAEVSHDYDSSSGSLALQWTRPQLAIVALVALAVLVAVYAATR